MSGHSISVSAYFIVNHQISTIQGDNFSARGHCLALAQLHGDVSIGHTPKTFQFAAANNSCDKLPIYTLSRRMGQHGFWHFHFYCLVNCRSIQFKRFKLIFFGETGETLARLAREFLPIVSRCRVCFFILVISFNRVFYLVFFPLGSCADRCMAHTKTHT